MGDDMLYKKSEREKHVFIIEFILSGKTPGYLLAEKKLEEAKWIVEYIRTGPPSILAMTDPSLFVRLRNSITKLMVKGWI